MCVYLFKSLTGRSRSPKAGSARKKKEGDVLSWQRSPILILQVEAGANSTNSKTHMSLMKEKIETTQKEK